jgi:hypothetical protein
MGTPTGTDPIIAELNPEGDGWRWSYRYGAAAEGHVLRAWTICCERPIYAPNVVDHGGVYGLVVDDCCDTPGIPKPVELPPYSGEHTTCRKCGSKAVETKFTTRAGDAVGRYGIPRPGYPVEWLARRCAVCQATWDEATVTAPGTADDAPTEPIPHNAAPWSVWGIGSTWWVHHAPSGMFLPVDRGSRESLTPGEMAKGGARLLGNGDGAEFTPLGDRQPGRWPRDQRMPTCIEGALYGEWYHRQCLEEYWAERGKPVIPPRTAADMNHYIFWWNERAARLAAADQPAATTTTSEPNAALLGLCYKRHPLAVRTTTTIEGDARSVHTDTVCPKCERDGTVGAIVLGGVDG